MKLQASQPFNSRILAISNLTLAEKANSLVIGLLLLKHIFALSDEEMCERWVYDPYFQNFAGEEFFQHAFPHERSDLSHWRKRLGEKLGLLLAESLRVAHEAGALRTKDLKRVTVDTTVQPKAITFPTDAKLLHAAIQRLNRLARRHGIRLRQSYLRITKRAAIVPAPATAVGAHAPIECRSTTNAPKGTGPWGKRNRNIEPY